MRLAGKPCATFYTAKIASEELELGAVASFHSTQKSATQKSASGAKARYVMKSYGTTERRALPAEKLWHDWTGPFPRRGMLLAF